MQIGLLLGEISDAGALGALAAEVEALGFDSLWAGDHIAYPGPILDPLQTLACWASHTQRLRLGTCVYLLALRHPTIVAKMVSSLDVLCGGRLTFGIGVGGEFPREFEASGVPVAERGARTNEAVGILRHLWSGEPAEHAGRFFRLPAVRLKPRPIQPGGPPIWIGGRSDAALRRASRLGDGYVGYLLDADGFRKRFERIQTMAAELGRAPLTGALMTFAAVDRDREAAVAQASTVLSGMYARPMGSAVERYCVAGDGAGCHEAVQRYAAAGVEHLIITPLAPRGGLRQQIQALAAALRR